MALETEGFSTPVEMFLKGQEKFLREIAKVEKRLDKISKKKITPTIGKQFSRDAIRALEQARTLQQTLNKLGRTNVKPKVDIGRGVFARQEKLASGLIKRLVGLAAAYIGVWQTIRLVGSSVRVFTELEDNLLATKAVTQATVEQFGALSNQAKELGRTTVKTAGESARAQTLLARAGFSVNEVLATVPALIDLSTAGQLELATATSITANILRAFDRDVDQVGRVMDVLALASSRANTTIGGLGEGAKFASPIFAALNLRIEEMAAAQAVLADRGLDATLGGTGLRISMQNLIDPTAKAKATLKSMGIELEDVDLKGESLVQVIELLASKNLSAAQAFEIFSARGGTAMLNLTAGVEKFGKLTTELLTDAEGTVKRMADTMQEGLGGSTRRLVSAVEAAQIAFASGLTPSLIDAQQRSVEFLNVNEQNLESLGRLAGRVLNVSAALASFFTGTGLTGGLAKEIDQLQFGVDGISRGVDDLQDRWSGANKAIAGGVEALNKRLVEARTELRSKEFAVKAFQTAAKRAGAFARQVEKAKLQMVESQAEVLALRQEIELLESAQEGVAEAEAKATEISVEHDKALKREEKAAKELAERVKALAETERDAERVTKKYTTAQERLTDELLEAERLFTLGAISVETYERAIESLEGQIDKLAISELQEKIDGLQQQLDLFKPDIQARVVIDDQELRDLLDIFDDEHRVNITLDTSGNEVVSFGSGAGVADALLPTSGEIAQFGKEYKAQLTKAQKLAIAFEDKWDDIANAGIQAAELIGGSFGSMIEGLISGIDSVQQGLAQIGQGGVANKIFGGLSAGQGIAGIGQSLGVFKGPQQQTQFGGLSEGDFSSEGGALGAIAGSFIPVIGTILGGVLGSVLGSLISKGADEGLAQIRQIGADVETTITKNEGGLGDILQSVGDSFTKTIEQIESILGADVLLGGLGEIVGGQGLSGQGVNVAFKIRGDIFRVFINGLERDFKTVEEGLQFAVLEALKSASFGEGLGEEVRKVLESGAFESIEELDIGISVAKMLDQGVTGTNQFAEAIARLNEEHKAITKVVDQFGLSQQKANALLNERLGLLKQDIDLSLQSALGVADRLTFAKQQEQAVLALNEALDADRVAREASLESLRLQEQELQEQATQIGQSTEAASEFGDMLVDLSETGFGRTIERGNEFNRSLQGTALSLEEVQQQIEDTEIALEGLPSSIDTQAIADAFNLAGRQSGQDLIAILQEINGQGFLNAEQDKLLNLSRQAQLAAQLASTQLLLASTTVLDATVRQVLETLLVEGQKTLEGLVAGTLTVGGGARTGVGRRKQRREQQARAAKEAARKLDDFNDSLQRLELNASTASGQLGDLASRIKTIAEEGAAALQFGADPEDVRRQQQLQLRGEREELLDPFKETGSIFDNFITESIDIEQLRRDAIEKARLIAQVQADLLGIPFEQAFAPMEEIIDRGAKRMQDALTRGVISAFGLPLENTRKKLNEFSRQMADLRQAFASGAVDSQRYKGLIDQIQAAQAQAVGSGVLSLIERFYEGVVGGEELRQQLTIANFELELAQLELTFTRLELEGALTEESIARIGGLLDFMQNNPPDWEAFFAGGPSDPDAGFTRIGTRPDVSTTINKVTQDFQALVDSVRGFLTGFAGIDVGVFQAQAQNWLASFEQFNTDIERTFSSEEAQAPLKFIEFYANALFGVTNLTQLTIQQIEELKSRAEGLEGLGAVDDLLDLITLGGDLESAVGQAPQKLLNLYKGTLEATSQLAGQYAAINDEFMDITTALELVSGSAEQLAEAESIRQEKVLAFWDSALSRTRELAESIRGGQFGGVASVAVVNRAEATLDDLVARLAADPLDFEALEQLDAAQMAFLEAQREFTGRVGPQFGAALDKILEISDSLQAVTAPTIEPLPAPPEVVLRMDDQAAIMQTQANLMSDMITLTTDRVTKVEEQHEEILAKMDEAILSNTQAIESAGPGLTPPS